jgi:hypothetical protein
MVLNFLDQRQAFRLGIAIDGEVQEHNFGMGAVDDIVNVFKVEFEVLGRVEAAVNNGGNAAGGAQFFGPWAAT